MTKSHWALALLLALPAYAQEEPPPEEAVVVEPVDEGESFGDDNEGESFSDYDEGESFSDYNEGESFGDYSEGESMGDVAAEDGGEAYGAPEPDQPLRTYVGADVVTSTLSFSGPSGFAGDEFDSGMYRLRGGMRLFKMVGAELQVGLNNGGKDATDVETDQYYGLFLVPTATVLETLELAFPVGYAMSSVKHVTGASANLDSVGYGIDAELPLRLFGESLPDLRLTAGWMVYYQKSDARFYGANFGLRYDFSPAGSP